MLRDLVEGQALEDVQAAWMRAEEPERRRWDEARLEQLRLRGEEAQAPDADSPIAHMRGNEGSGRLLPNGTAPYDNGVTYPQSTFDIGNLLDQDDAFLPLLDAPPLLAVLSQVCGAGGFEAADEKPADSPYHGIVRCGGVGGRVVPSEANEEGYLTWHRDKPAADNWPLPNYRLIKVFIAIFDIPESGGATVRRHSPTQNRMLLTHRSRFRQAVVPGSHRFATQPRVTLARSYGGGATVGALSHYEMPNHIECAVDAGSAVLFDSSIWHTSMP